MASRSTGGTFFHGLASSLFVLAIFGILATIVSGVPSTSGAWHALENVSRTPSDLTSVDADLDGLIDNAELACGAGVNCVLNGADITANSIATSHLLDNSVTAAKINVSCSVRKITGVAALFVTSSCQAGETLMGGGCACPGQLLRISRPLQPGNNGWECFCDAFTGSSQPEAHAICCTI